MLLRALSRKKLGSQPQQPQQQAPRPSDYTAAVLGASRGAQPVTNGVAQTAVTRVEPEGQAGPAEVLLSAANYRANDPPTDSHILQSDSKHLFAAVLSAKPSVRGAAYLRQHLHGELQAQLRRLHRDAPKAMVEALRRLDASFRSLHPFNNAGLEGVSLAVAYADLQAGLLHVGSSGGCRCGIGRSDGELLAVEGPQQFPREALQGSWADASIATLPIDSSIDTIILGSIGLWKEVAPGKAVLRLRHWHAAAPGANGGSAAAQLANFALHCVTRRLRGHADPRMRSLRSVGSLQSLPAGDVSQFKWAGRQPVRRRRGDVHGDLTAVVFRLAWQGTPDPAPPAASRWALARLHFLDFPRAARAATQQQWRELAQRALTASRASAAVTPKEEAAKPAFAASPHASRPPSFDVSVRAVAAAAR